MDRDPDTEEHLIESLARQRAEGFPVLVADENGDVVGDGSYEHFRGQGKWPGYRYTVEHSVHVRESHWRQGIGCALMEALMDHARGAGYHVMVGGIDSDNLASIRFHERLGFTETARMPEVGQKFGRWLTLVFVQRALGGRHA